MKWLLFCSLWLVVPGIHGMARHTDLHEKIFQQVNRDNWFHAFFPASEFRGNIKHLNYAELEFIRYVLYDALQECPTNNEQVIRDSVLALAYWIAIRFNNEELRKEIHHILDANTPENQFPGNYTWAFQAWRQAAQKGHYSFPETWIQSFIEQKDKALIDKPLYKGMNIIELLDNPQAALLIWEVVTTDECNSYEMPELSNALECMFNASPTLRFSISYLVMPKILTKYKKGKNDGVLIEKFSHLFFRYQAHSILLLVQRCLKRLRYAAESCQEECDFLRAYLKLYPEDFETSHNAIKNLLHSRRIQEACGFFRMINPHDYGHFLELAQVTRRVDTLKFYQMAPTANYTDIAAQLNNHKATCKKNPDYERYMLIKEQIKLLIDGTFPRGFGFREAEYLLEASSCPQNIIRYALEDEEKWGIVILAFCVGYYLKKQGYAVPFDEQELLNIAASGFNEAEFERILKRLQLLIVQCVPEHQLSTSEFAPLFCRLEEDDIEEQLSPEDERALEIACRYDFLSQAKSSKGR